LTRSELTLRYIAFAGIAIGTNLAAQAIVFAAYSGPLELALAIAVGTIVGLVVKFELDRRLIFYAPRQDAGATGVTFLFYAATGLFTTAIFWGTETLAYLTTHGAPGSQYAGGFVGLTIGYLVKYQLDKRYVFRG
jgi:putative flippase GtrA